LLTVILLSFEPKVLASLLVAQQLQQDHLGDLVKVRVCVSHRSA
jgi:hypothetical protein